MLFRQVTPDLRYYSHVSNSQVSKVPTTCRPGPKLVVTCPSRVSKGSGMTEDRWQAIGRIAKKRRERLRLNQEDLTIYGGPKVATVGKFERAAQPNFPPRTQAQMEAALGWPAGTIAEYLDAYDSYDVLPSKLHDWERSLIEDGLPDLRRPELVSTGNRSGVPQNEEFEGHLLMIRGALSVVDPDRWGMAALRAVQAIAEYRVEPQNAWSVPRAIRPLSEPSDTTESSVKAAHDEVEPIERGQGYDDNA